MLSLKSIPKAQPLDRPTQSVATLPRALLVGFFSVLVAMVLLAMIARTPLASVQAPPDWPDPDAALGEHRFQVFLNDRPIGEHRFQVQRDQRGLRVFSEAEFKVKMLVVPVFSYQHTAEERWQDGCLQRLDSTTYSNGEQFSVELERQDDDYRIQTLDGESTAEQGCLKTFAYWDAMFLDEQQLLNAQTGELLPVDVEPVTDAPPAWLQATGPVRGYRITTLDQQTNLDVYYTADTGRWIGLTSRLSPERIMRYQPFD